MDFNQLREALCDEGLDSKTAGDLAELIIKNGGLDYITGTLLTIVNNLTS